MKSKSLFSLVAFVLCSHALFASSSVGGSGQGGILQGTIHCLGEYDSRIDDMSASWSGATCTFSGRCDIGDKGLRIEVEDDPADYCQLSTASQIKWEASLATAKDICEFRASGLNKGVSTWSGTPTTQEECEGASVAELFAILHPICQERFSRPKVSTHVVKDLNCGGTGGGPNCVTP